MTTVAWKEIDTNGNGYVDKNEVANAEKKGVKNVWENMTQNDYQNGVTREDKLNNIVNSVYTSDIVIHTDSYIGYKEEELQAMKSREVKVLESSLLQCAREQEIRHKKCIDTINKSEAELDKLPSEFSDILVESYYNFKFWIKEYFYDPNNTINRSFGAPSMGEQRDKYMQSSLGKERYERIITRSRIKSEKNRAYRDYAEFHRSLNTQDLVERYKYLRGN